MTDSTCEWKEEALQQFPTGMWNRCGDFEAAKNKKSEESERKEDAQELTATALGNAVQARMDESAAENATKDEDILSWTSEGDADITKDEEEETNEFEIDANDEDETVPSEHAEEKGTLNSDSMDGQES